MEATKFQVLLRRPGRRTALVAVLGLLLAGAVAPAPKTQDIEATRSALEQWVQTERVISKERTDWLVGKEALEMRVRLVEQEIETLSQRIAEAKASITEADTKRSGLVEEHEELKATGEGLTNAIAELEARTKALLVRLPEPIVERIRPLSQALPEDPAAAKVGLGTRFQNVVGVLNQVDRFHREITLNPEVRELGDGRTAEVAVLYVGASRGYFATADGLFGGMGYAGPNGWVWTSANDAAPEIARAVAILQNQAIADYVGLPFRLQ